MSSSENRDCGMFSGRRSNFSQTCSKLSQYLKERGSFGDLNVGLSPNSQQQDYGISSPKTKDLLPMIEKAGQKMDAPTREVEPERSQMTIFYGGQVIVFNDLPADKAKEIMGMAGKIGSSKNNTNTNTNNMVQKPSTSLVKFFEKRKERIAARAPYQVRNKAGPDSRTHDNKTWLGLAAQSSDQ